MDLMRAIFFYFLVYSFLGWIIEGLFNLITKGHFTKPNFLYAPLKPMYGLAAVLLIRLYSLLPLWLFLPCCFIIPVMIEYLTAFWLLNAFHLRYWDYSNCSWQLSGFICLRFCIYWGILSFILIFCFQPLNNLVYLLIIPLWFYFFPIMLLLFVIDFLLTLRKHLQLNA